MVLKKIHYTSCLIFRKPLFNCVNTHEYSKFSAMFIDIKLDIKPPSSQNSGSRFYSCTTKLPTTTKCEAGIKLLNMTLLASMLILIAGDVSLNPGPKYQSFTDVASSRELNLRSLRNKFDLVSVELGSNKLFVLMVSKTWLDKKISDSEVKFDGYNIFRRDRLGNCYGVGVLIYLRENLPGQIREDLNKTDNECLWNEVNHQKCKPILLCCTHKSPSADTTKFVDCLMESFSLVNQGKYDIILLGDLNVDFLGNGLKHAYIKHASRLPFRNFAILSNLTQVIKAPARITSTSRTILVLFQCQLVIIFWSIAC